MPARPHASPPTPTRTRRAALGIAGALALVVLSAGLASAHVVVHSDSTAPGSEAEMTFRVPSEAATASTVQLQVTLPTDHPLAEVEAKPVPGWRITVVEAKLPTPVVDEGTTITTAPHTVTWTAVSKQAGIPPEQFQDFSINAGPLPASGAVTFAAKQTYSDGTVVTWDQPTVPGQDEPEHPAPSFTIQPAAHATPADAPRSSTRPTSDGTARWLAGAALLVALVGLASSAAQGLRGRGPR